MEISYPLSEINRAAEEFWKMAKDYRVIAFNGDMGAGKTTFIHAVCGHLKVKDVVSSPTFALINEYRFDEGNGADCKIFHMDLYRINNEEEAMQAGIEDAIMDEQAYSFVEWAEKIRTLLPKPYLDVVINIADDNQRVLSFEAIV